MEVTFKFNRIGDWVIYDTRDSGFFSKEAMGIASVEVFIWKKKEINLGGLFTSQTKSNSRDTTLLMVGSSAWKLRSILGD